MKSRGTCDKCQQPVEPGNDAVVLEFVLQWKRLPSPASILLYGSRHLFPTAGCPGSPSRAQYLGGARVSRARYSYSEAQAGPMRAARALMIQLLEKGHA